MLIAKISLQAICSRLLKPFAFVLAGAIGFSGNAAFAVSFKFNYKPDIDARALAGFQAAGDRWSALFTDDVTVNIDIGFEALGSGSLGQTGSTKNLYSYTNVVYALAKHANSADDFTAVSNLPKVSAFNLLIDRTTNNPNGSGSATPYLDNNRDANNSNIYMTSANAKALGLLTGKNAASDGSITFNSMFNWDFNPSNGIDASAYDFVGVATHEIGHALGFNSGVDVLDYSSSKSKFFNDKDFTFVSTMDLFRFSQDSVAKGKGVIDWTADTRDKYFSIDGGTTKIASFATGESYGDGQQASHWKDNLDLGIMDPSLGPGEVLKIMENDQRLFDVIGWTRATTTPRTSVPEPESLVELIALGAVFLLIRSKRPANRNFTSLVIESKASSPPSLHSI